MAYGASQARGLIGAVATGLCQSHSNVGSEMHLRPTPQLTATLDPQPTEQGQGSNPKPHGSYCHGVAKMNPTRNHEVAGSIPGLAQWVKDPALP